MSLKYYIRTNSSCTSVSFFNENEYLIKKEDTKFSYLGKMKTFSYKEHIELTDRINQIIKGFKFSYPWYFIGPFSSLNEAKLYKANFRNSIILDIVSSYSKEAKESLKKEFTKNRKIVQKIKSTNPELFL